MAGYNRIVIMGNLTRDPDYKQIASGQAVCRLGLASNRQYRNKASGTMIQEVCYIDVDVWGSQAESCRQYLQKGRPVLIEGRLKYDTWTDPDGKNRNKHSIVADRVVFLSAGSGAAEEVDAGMEDTKLDAEPMIDPALSKQINDVQARTKAKISKAAVIDSTASRGFGRSEQQLTDDGGINFQDEAPFKEELPF